MEQPGRTRVPRRAAAVSIAACTDAASTALLAALPLAGLLFGPVYASLAWVFGGLRVLSAWALHRAAPVPDQPLAFLAACAVLLCLGGAAWSIAPARTAMAACQLALILGASLAVLSDRSLPPAWAARAFGAMSLALLLGVAVLCLDRALHFPLEHRLSPNAAYPGTKYNRGEDYLTLLLWPLVAFWWLSGRFWRALLLLGAVCLAAWVGLSTTARVTLPASLCLLLAAAAKPAATRRLMAIATMLMAASLPLLLHVLAMDRALLWFHLKQSGLHRLEIWHYMTARVFERPLLGWGLATAKLVPIHPAEQRGFVFVNPHGVYPHQQWLQLWLETGAAGVSLGTLFALLILRRIGRMQPRLAPFACAAFAAAMAVSFSSFELTTDSWWAALALTAMLLRLAGEAALP